jgi:cytochrome c5
MSLRLPAAALALSLGLAAPVLAQSPNDALPEGPGKDVTVRVCTACHDASQFAAARYSPDEWDTEINKMEGAGADITAEDHVAIAAYLAKYLPKTPPAK